MREARALFAGVGALALTIVVSGSPVSAGEPANKFSAAGSTNEVVGPGSEVTILSENVKTSNPADLLLAVTLECSIVTDVTTVGNDDQSALSRVTIWIEIDGKPVPVADNDQNEGRVVFCNRRYQRQTSMFDDEDATIATIFSTRSTHGFNWVAMNVGSATHHIEVKATLETEQTDKSNAEAVVGNRTLVVDAMNASVDETVQEQAPTPTPKPSSPSILPKL